jgi:hypothetical protein
VRGGGIAGAEVLGTGGAAGPELEGAPDHEGGGGGEAVPALRAAGPCWVSSVACARSDTSSAVGASAFGFRLGAAGSAAGLAARTGGTAANRGIGASIADGKRTSTSPSLKQKSIRSE